MIEQNKIRCTISIVLVYVVTNCPNASINQTPQELRQAEYLSLGPAVPEGSDGMDLRRSFSAIRAMWEGRRAPGHQVAPQNRQAVTARPRGPWVEITRDRRELPVSHQSDTLSESSDNDSPRTGYTVLGETMVDSLKAKFAEQQEANAELKAKLCENEALYKDLESANYALHKDLGQITVDLNTIKNQAEEAQTALVKELAEYKEELIKNQRDARSLRKAQDALQAECSRAQNSVNSLILAKHGLELQLAEERKGNACLSTVNERVLHLLEELEEANEKLTAEKEDLNTKLQAVSAKHASAKAAAIAIIKAMTDLYAPHHLNFHQLLYPQIQTLVCCQPHAMQYGTAPWKQFAAALPDHVAALKAV